MTRREKEATEIRIDGVQFRMVGDFKYLGVELMKDTIWRKR